MKQCFEDMTKNERKHFLNMDLVERMIRVEQRVSASFRKYVSYDKTEYFQSLTPCQRAEFEKYLRAKKLKKTGILFIFSFILGIMLIGGLNMTGNVTGIGNLATVSWGLILFAIAVFALIWFLIWRGGKKRRHRRLESHIKILHRYVG